ncbi:MAG: hypothetical protein OEW33_13355 [Nitrospirota bacterium]|nr:hypothetical protein [Nitrospirota bacterium]
MASILTPPRARGKLVMNNRKTLWICGSFSVHHIGEAVYTMQFTAFPIIQHLDPGDTRQGYLDIMNNFVISGQQIRSCKLRVA